MIHLSLPTKYRALINQERLQLAARETLNALRYSESPSVAVKLTTDRQIRQLNRVYREVDSPTDVLSFENEYIDPETGERFVGDIAISLETAGKQADGKGHTLQEEVEMLLVHGILHLGGLDHSSDAERERMLHLQDSVLSKLGNPLIGSIQSEC